VPGDKFSLQMDVRGEARDRRALIWFLIFAFAPTWSVWTLLWVMCVHASDTVRFALFGTAGMYFPGLAALGVQRFILKEGLGTSTLFRIGRARFYLWAWMLFPILIVITVCLDLSTNTAQLDRDFSHLQSLFAVAGRPPPADLRQFAIGQLMTALLIGPPLHALTTIGEEVGWRDFLLRRLIRTGFNEWTALLISGAIWGLWHIPVILLGLEYVNNPFLGIPVFVVYATLVGIILGWLQLASGSVWVPAIAHGSINAVQRALLVFITGYNGLISGGLGSVIGWLPLTAFIVWLACSRRLPVRDVSQPLQE
jgi:membrane protease YdiL (CAAX protease family)